jgi:hypothetical protein
MIRPFLLQSTELDFGGRSRMVSTCSVGCFRHAQSEGHRDRVQSNEGARGRDDRRSPSGKTLATADVRWFQSAWRLPGHEERSRLPRCFVFLPPFQFMFIYIKLCYVSLLILSICIRDFIGRKWSNGPVQ